MAKNDGTDPTQDPQAPEATPAQPGQPQPESPGQPASGQPAASAQPVTEGGKTWPNEAARQESYQALQARATKAEQEHAAMTAELAQARSQQQPSQPQYDPNYGGHGEVPQGAQDMFSNPGADPNFQQPNPNDVPPTRAEFKAALQAQAVQFANTFREYTGEQEVARRYSNYDDVKENVKEALGGLFDQETGMPNYEALYEQTYLAEQQRLAMAAANAAAGTTPDAAAAAVTGAPPAAGPGLAAPTEKSLSDQIGEGMARGLLTDGGLPIPQ